MYALSGVHKAYEVLDTKSKSSQHASKGMRHVLEKLGRSGVVLTVADIRRMDNAKLQQVQQKRRIDGTYILNKKEGRVMNLFRKNIRTLGNVDRKQASERVEKILLQAEIRSLRKNGKKIEKSRKAHIKERCKVLKLDIRSLLPERLPGNV